MTLLSPLWLFVGLVAVLVVLLHAHRRREVLVSSTIFLARLADAEAQRSAYRLPKLTLPLVLQVLAILLCALALARPAFLNQSSDRHLIYLLDSSASMQVRDETDGVSRFDAAVDQIARELGKLDDADQHRLTLLALGATVEPLAVRFQNKSDLLERLREATTQDQATDLTELPTYIEAVKREGETSEVILVSDNLSPPSGADRVYGFGRTDVPNASLDASASLGTAPGDWLVTGTVSYNTAQRPDGIRKQFKPHGGRAFIDLGILPLRGLRTVGDEVKTLSFTDTIALPGAGVLKLSLPEDAAAFDDTVWLPITPEPTELQVLYLARSDRPLPLALSALDNIVVTRSETLPNSVAGYDFVIADNVVLPEAPKTNVIWFGSARTADSTPPQFNPSPHIAAWNTEHHLSNSLPWKALPAAPAYVLPADDEASLLLSSDAGPVISVATTLWGRELRIGLPPDSPAWAQEPILPILLNRFMDWTGLRAGPVMQCEIGEDCALPISALVGAVHGPDGLIAFEPNAMSDSFVPRQGGVYILADGRELVVNATRLEEVERDLPETVAQLPEPWPIWRWLILVAILALAVELIIVSRKRALGLIILRAGVLGLLVAAVLVVPGLGLVERHKSILVRNSLGANCPTDDLRLCAQEQSGQHTITAERLEHALRLALASVAPAQSGIVGLEWESPLGVSSASGLVPSLVTRNMRLEVLRQYSGEQQGAYAYLDYPEPIMAGERFNLSAYVFSPQAGQALLTLSRNGEILSSQSLDLSQGWGSSTFEVEPIHAGEHLFDLQLRLGDAEHAFTQAVMVAPPLAVAIVSPHAEWANLLASALEVQNIVPTVIPPTEAPEDIEGWRRYDAVVMLNTPAILLSTAQQSQLDEFVRQHGGGLLLLGGENSFGPGGYYRTPLEDLSPLSAHVPEERPVVALAFVLDRSGSMQADVGGMSRLEVAKQATLGAVELLSEDSQVAIIVFDAEGHLVAPLAEKDTLALEAALGRVTPGGGTYFMPGLEQGLAQLLSSNAPKRHMILMTDGVSQPGNHAEFAAAAFQEGISLSVVAIGTGTDTEGVAGIAQRGGGKFHSTQDFLALPSILSQEALMLDSEPMVPGVHLVRKHDTAISFLSGLDSPFPPVQGFVKTSLKPGATLHLEALDGEDKTWPLLASWRHGNGQVVAFATHGIGQGTAQWLDALELPLLWGQAIRQSSHSLAADEPLDITRVGDDIHVFSREGATTLRVSFDEGSWGDLALRPRADGSSATTLFAQPGQYAFEVESADPIGAMPVERRLFVPSVANPLQAHPNLARLAEMTRGNRGAHDEPWVFPWALGLQPLWREWVLLAVAVLLLELTLHYGRGAFGTNFALRNRLRGPIQSKQF